MSHFRNSIGNPHIKKKKLLKFSHSLYIPLMSTTSYCYFHFLKAFKFTDLIKRVWKKSCEDKVRTKLRRDLEITSSQLTAN